MYEASKRLEAIPLAGRKVSSRTETMGLVLKYYRWRYQMRQEPCFAVAGKDDYLSEFSRKEKGCVYIPLDVLKNYSEFRLVIGPKGHRKVIQFTDCHIVNDGVNLTFCATCNPVSDEEKAPKEVPAIVYWQPKERETAELPEIIEETETYIIREVRA